MLRLLCLSLFLMASITSVGQSQEADNPSRPKIGLVLSGGGAKGLAHIGVLKVIDSLGIQVDYVGGTSMGAIVGSLYASGYSGKQLDSIFQVTNFDTIVRDELPRSARTPYERERDERYAVTLPFDNFQLSLPRGFTAGQNVYDLMNRLYGEARDITNFKELPIPFLCIATDIETGKQRVFESGYLPQVVSASGALPSLYAPVKIDGRIYTDGGVVNNYPVQELRDRGMDIIIGVDVQDDLRTREELVDGLDVLLQINNYRTIQDMQEKSILTDVYITPDIEGFSVIDFNAGQEIISSGVAAAQQHLDMLSSYAAQSPVTSPRHAPTASDNLNITGIALLGNETYRRAYVVGKLQLQLPEQITYDQLSERIHNLQTTGNFTRVDYRIEEDESGGDVLVLEVDESPAKTTLNLSAHYDPLFKTSALINLTRKGIVWGEDIASLDFIIGDNLRYNANYYVDKGQYWSIGINSSFDEFNERAPASLLESQNSGLDLQVNSVTVNYRELTNQLYFQTVFRNFVNLRLGAEYKRFKIFSETLTSEQDETRLTLENGDFSSAFGQLRYDTQDDRYFPTSGFSLFGEFKLFLLGQDNRGEFSQFSLVQGDLSYTYPITSYLSVMVQGAGGFRLGGYDGNAFDYFLGGYGGRMPGTLKQFIGNDHLEMAGDAYIYALGKVDFHPWDEHHFQLFYNQANVEDSLYEGGDYFSELDLVGYGVGYGYESFIGPMQIIYSYSPISNASQWYFSVGYWF